MAVISARIDDRTKTEAEEIANSIGLSLSTVINVFLNRFVAERGFPFSVTDPKKVATVFEKDELEALVINAVKNNTASQVSPPSSYLDPNDQAIKVTK